jgi:NAD(P)-dependent dehydrogenase (short-subunit alcohol dehydrogenase family)
MATATMEETVDNTDNLSALFDVREKIALVTGGASGLGLAMASALVEFGAIVVVADREQERLDAAVSSLSSLTETGGDRVVPALLDVGDAEQVKALVDGMVASHGSIDIVFANAGVALGTPPLVPYGQIDEFGFEDYYALLDVNLHGVVHSVRAAARHMKRQSSGSIVVTASTAGLRNDPFVPYSYAIAKAGVVNFMKQAAHDLARWNVRVNAIAPGPFKTNLGRSGSPTAGAAGAGAAPAGAAANPINAQAEERWKAVIPLGRMGDPSEMRGLALLLASPASSFMTGGVYPIDGGALLQGPSLPPP